MIIIINISSKNYVSLINFVKKFTSKNFTKKLKIFVKKDSTITPTKSKLYTVLKSPHVNKTAQEQFTSKMFNIQIELFLYQPKLFFLFFKVLKNKLVSDIVISYKISTNKLTFEQKINLILTPNSLKYYFINKKLKKRKFFIKQYLKLTELYGKFLLENKKVFV